MAPTDLAESLETTTTRRRIVKTGAKFVYAAPLVVASMRVSQLQASARQVVSGSTWPGDDEDEHEAKHDYNHKDKKKDKQKDKNKNKS